MTIKKKSIIFVLVIMMVLGGCSSERKDLPKANSTDFKDTMVSPTMETKIQEGKNIIYCSTFQLAWNELKNNIIKEDIKLKDEQELSPKLNKGLSTKADIFESDYVAIADFKRNNVVQKINDELMQKFKDSAPKLADDLGDEDTILAYAYLYKNLKFAHELESLSEPISFTYGNQDIDVNAFGIKEYKSGKHDKFDSIVEILDYQDDNDFIIRLNSKSENDEIILAKIAPGDTLLETIQKVEKRIQNCKPESLQEDDSLQIPKIGFDLTHSYSELVDKYLMNKGFRDYYIAEARQDILFRLDEKGAELKSQAKIVLSKGGVMESRNLIFNQPYLIYLKEKGGKYPYFAIWIETPEFMNP